MVWVSGERTKYIANQHQNKKTTKNNHVCPPWVPEVQPRGTPCPSWARLPLFVLFSLVSALRHASRGLHLGWCSW